jgi:hypothetical protein
MAEHPEGYAFPGGYPTPETVQRGLRRPGLQSGGSVPSILLSVGADRRGVAGNLDNGTAPNRVYGAPGQPRAIGLQARLRHALRRSFLRPGTARWRSKRPVLRGRIQFCSFSPDVSHEGTHGGPGASREIRPSQRAAEEFP